MPQTWDKLIIAQTNESVKHTYDGQERYTKAAFKNDLLFLRSVTPYLGASGNSNSLNLKVNV